VLVATSLRKSFAGREVVSGVSLSIAPGEIVGLLGPNGAGKSTTVGMLCGLVMPDSGQASIDDALIEGEASDVKRRIGLVPQDLALFEDLSAKANLNLFGALYGVAKPLRDERTAQALNLVGLSDRANDKPASFSGGMKRRLNIACALIHDPDVLLFDEPTVGVDPQSRNAIFDNLETLKARGKAILYTTHYMEEAERLCDRVMIMDHGKVVASDTLQGLYRKVAVKSSLTIGVASPVNAQELKTLSGITFAAQYDGVLEVGVEDLSRDVTPLLQWLAKGGHIVHSLHSGRVNLEDVFLALTGSQLRD